MFVITNIKLVHNCKHWRFEMYFDSSSELNNAIIQEFLDASYQEFLTENDDVSNDLIDEMIEVDIMNDATEEQLESCFSIPTLDLKTYYEDWESWFEKFNAQYMDKLEKTCSVCL